MSQDIAHITKHKTISQQQLKAINALLIFQLIYKNGPVSRAKLAKMAKLSPTTVSSLADDMIKKGLVQETGAGKTASSGRKPILLDIHPNGGYSVSVELLEKEINCTIYNIRCKTVANKKVVLADSADIGYEAAAAVKTLTKTSKISPDKLLGICVSVPGLIDYEHNRAISSTAIELIEQADLFQPIKDHFKDIPLFLENESNLCAYAEMVFGSVDGTRNLVFIHYIGSGIGGGIVLNGSVFRGSGGISGEVGHVCIDMNGPRCKCGSRGCLEMMAGIPAIVQMIIFGIMTGRETVVTELVQGDFNLISMDVIQAAANRQDAFTLEILDIIADRLAFGINNVVNLVNPELVVIGGEIRIAGDQFLDRVRRSLSEIMLKPNTDKVQVRFSGLDETAASLGGARFVLDNRFKLSDL